MILVMIKNNNKNNSEVLLIYIYKIYNFLLSYTALLEQPDELNLHGFHRLPKYNNRNKKIILIKKKKEKREIF